jgi:hypothetical protein
MQRRKFVQETGMIVISIGVFRPISWRKGSFISDTPTTPDLLGVVLKAGPERKNINAKA